MVDSGREIKFFQPMRFLRVLSRPSLLTIKKYFIFLLFAIILVALFCLLKAKTSENRTILKINDHKFSVEIADISEKRSRGLGKRENLCPDCGMLFAFPSLGEYSFWMKDMNFPLDIIWIANEKIIYLARNISPELAGTINPGIKADKVLEINGGLSDKYGLREGDEIKFK